MSCRRYCRRRRCRDCRFVRCRGRRCGCRLLFYRRAGAQDGSNGWNNANESEFFHNQGVTNVMVDSLQVTLSDVLNATLFSPRHFIFVANKT